MTWGVWIQYKRDHDWKRDVERLMIASAFAVF